MEVRKTIQVQCQNDCHTRLSATMKEWPISYVRRSKLFWPNHPLFLIFHYLRFWFIFSRFSKEYDRTSQTKAYFTISFDVDVAFWSLYNLFIWSCVDWQVQWCYWLFGLQFGQIQRKSEAYFLWNLTFLCCTFDWA